MDKIIAILRLLPAIIEAIKALEAAIPGSGQGEAKLAALRGILEAADSTITNLWPTIERVVGVVVGLFNKTGAFAKS